MDQQDDESAPTPTAPPGFHNVDLPSRAPRYLQCLRNHAASIGGHAIDGCGEFMPSLPADPLMCAACGCHRSFHRKAWPRVSTSPSSSSAAGGPFLPPPPYSYRLPSTQHHGQLVLHQPPVPPSPPPGLGGGASGSGGGATVESSSEERMPPPLLAGAPTKRQRTKFTAEQKERMREFAEKVGWRIQRQDEAAAEAFCAQLGVRRQVLRVWMHNHRQPAPRPPPPLPPAPAAPPGPPTE